MKLVVAFSSPKRSAKTIEMAATHAKATESEIILLRIIPDPEKLGVIAQLISSDRPADKAQLQIDQCVKDLQSQGIKASGIVKSGEVASGIVQAAIELKADCLYVGTTNIGGPNFFLMKKDPILHYIVDNCPITLCLVRHDGTQEAIAETEEEAELG